MKILVIGSGGREHALVLQILKSNQVAKVFAAPGNAGMASVAECVPIAVDQISELLTFAQKNQIDLTVVGPELPLTLGIVDEFNKAGLKIFGPSQKASQLEASKAFTKDFCARYQIPTAAYQCFTDVTLARAHLQARVNFPVVIKADGLAAGKGVVIAQNAKEADDAVAGMMCDARFGSAGKKIVIEDFLNGIEASFIVMTDGKSVVAFPPAQDHKRIFDNDLGPNTGGMGAYAPAPFVTEAVIKKIRERIIEPTLAGMEKEGSPFVGFLFAGLMINAQGDPYLIEYNCRFGDPEAEVILPLITSDFASALLDATEQKLDPSCMTFAAQTCVGVVLASGGYPDSYQKDFLITGLNDISDSNVTVFHAGTRKKDANAFVTDGGRVLVVSAKAASLKEAINKAYQNITKISWSGMQYRKDIGAKGLK